VLQCWRWCCTFSAYWVSWWFFFKLEYYITWNAHLLC